MMPLPLDRHDVRDFAAGLDDMLVIEEKNATLELLVRDALVRRDRAAACVGQARRRRPGRRALPRAARRRPRSCPPCGSISAPRLGDRLAPGAPAPRPQPDPTQRRARAVLLLRVPAQHQHAGRAGHAGRRRHRLPRDGGADGRRSRGRCRRPHVHGQRGCAMDRHGAVHRAPAPRPEPRRRHVLPLRFAGDPGGGRGRHRHHVQAALQRHGGDDRRAGRARRARRPRRHAACCSPTASRA